MRALHFSGFSRNRGPTLSSHSVTNRLNKVRNLIHEDTTKLIADLAKTVLEEPKPEQFLAHIVNRTLASIDARGAILGVIEREGFLDLQGTYGYEEELVKPFMRIPLWSPLPITDAGQDLARLACSCRQRNWLRNIQI